MNLVSSLQTQRSRFNNCTTLYSQSSESRGYPRIYELPALNTQELRECLKEMQLDVSDHDLLHPTSQRVQHLFECILQIFVPWRMKHVDAAKQTAANTFGHQELRQDLASLLALHKQMKILLNDLRHSDFNMQDLTNPAPQRLARVLSTLINYAKFRQQEWERFEVFAADAETLGYDAAQLDQKNNDLRQHIAELEQRRKIEEPEIRLAAEKNTRYEEDLRQMRRVADERQAARLRLKEERHALKDTLQETQYMVLNAVNEIKQLKARANYDRQKAMENNALLADAIHQDHAQVDSADAALKSLITQADSLAGIARDVGMCVDVMESANKRKHEYEHYVDDNKKMRKAIQEYDEERLQLTNHNRAAQRQLEELRAEVSRIEKLQEQKRETLNLQLEKNKEEVDQVNTKVANGQIRLAEEQAKVEALQKEIQQKKTEYETNLERFQDAYSELLVKLDLLLDRTTSFTKHL